MGCYEIEYDCRIYVEVGDYLHFDFMNLICPVLH